MKRSIRHLPKRTQEELNLLLELIKHYIPKCEMIILFGSYARGGYVLWDERVEFGIHTSYQSDLDIMLVLHQSHTRITEQRLREKVLPRYHKALEGRRHASPQFIVEDSNILNKELEKQQYFYTEIVKDGIKMYDTKAFKLAKPRELSFREIKKIAEDELEICYRYGSEYLRSAKDNLVYGSYNTASFLTHQSCERFYYAITLVFKNYRPKTHKLVELAAMVKEYSRDLSTVFPQDTAFEKHCYDLLCRAYIEARYNKDFVVTKEELEYMIARVEVLKEITERICTEKIASYDKLIE
jgi:uncharacterized protein